MTPGLIDTFPGTTDTFPGHIGPFSWTYFHGYIDNLTLGQGVKYQYFQLPGMPGNVCRKGLKFPEIPGNLNW